MKWEGSAGTPRVILVESPAIAPLPRRGPRRCWCLANVVARWEVYARGFARALAQILARRPEINGSGILRELPSATHPTEGAEGKGIWPHRWRSGDLSTATLPPAKLTERVAE